ncbi:MAG: TRAP transporter large permease [Paracoccus sp. (in: a-proteobacteria)]|uniref:TRAP transporter large permease n=1 Tax=Paracoccus sp. TaxID=267 RepID=UPI0026DFF9CA|nr:TRAP transporter large permease [Paracoccus sp. (in: a-proteobacteria)]MDO5631605.1 TRAP transporter large permease [Paracoccus sp. (in: a-proteobacteria)]
MDLAVLALILTGTITFCILIGVPLALSIIAGSFAAIFAHGGANPVIAAQRLFAGMDNFSLMAIPAFLFAGAIMSNGGISSRLIDFGNALVGRFTGGLAISNVLSSLMFGGISGSAVADTATIGGTFIPEMKKAGYPVGYSVGITAASSPISPLIPPSIAWIVYAYITDQSVMRMFLAGLVPGLMWAVALMVAAWFLARRHNYPTQPPASFSTIWDKFIIAFPALITPVLLLGGILSALFTVTEASVVLCVYAMLISGLVYRELTWKVVIDSLTSAMRLTAAVMIILAGASLFAWMLAWVQAPEGFGAWLQGFVTSPMTFLILVNILLLLIGMVMEVNAAKVMLLPVLFPISQQLGIDPIHFGVVITVNLCIGLITPPIGIVLAIASTIGGISIIQGTRAITPFLIVALLVLALLTFVPVLSTFLPDLLMGPRLS